MNNLDVIILAVVFVSAMIALARGLTKEVLSIVGWVLATVAVVCLLPILTPFAMKFVASAAVAGVAAALVILILFMVFWTLGTARLVTKIRSSKLDGLDRALGLLFGVARAALLVVLFNILVNMMAPKDMQSDTLAKSRYFNLAGRFAKPIEELIPEATMEMIRSAAVETGAAEDKTGEKEKKRAEEEARQKEAKELFEKLAQPQVKKKEKGGEAYDSADRKGLDKLVEGVE